MTIRACYGVVPLAQLGIACNGCHDACIGARIFGQALGNTATDAMFATLPRFSKTSKYLGRVVAPMRATNTGSYLYPKLNYARINRERNPD